MYMNSLFNTDLVKTLTSVFNPTKLTFEQKKDLSEEDLNKLGKLNETLGNLYYVIRQKQMLLSNALISPIGIMVGGNLLQVGGVDTDDDAPDGDAAAGSTRNLDKEKVNDLSFVAPDLPVRKLYSVSTVLANILKKHENDLVKNFSEMQLREIANLLKETRKSEQTVYETVFKMNELQSHLRDGNIDDNSVGTLKQLVHKGREAHKKQMDETRKTFDKLSNLMIVGGLPPANVAFLSN